MPKNVNICFFSFDQVAVERGISNDIEHFPMGPKNPLHRSITRDVYQQMWHPEVKAEALTGMSRAVTLALSLLALGTALTVSLISPDRTIFWYAIFGWSGIAATFCPVIILSLAWPRYNVHGALASMLTGFFSIPLFKFAVPLVPVWGPVISLAEELAPAFLMALATGIVATLLTPTGGRVEQ